MYSLIPLWSVDRVCMRSVPAHQCLRWCIGCGRSTGALMQLACASPVSTPLTALLRCVSPRHRRREVLATLCYSGAQRAIRLLKKRSKLRTHELMPLQSGPATALMTVILRQTHMQTDSPLNNVS
eukprot:m.573117 g.573117  ORF g.573117 m.573117 type:complete len:125 (+) comp22277_c0_seq3:183-557(+)